MKVRVITHMIDKYSILLLILSICCCTQNKNRSVTFERKPDTIENLIKLHKPFKHKDFEVFYQRFITDSAFQISHIKFPIKGYYTDYDTNQKWERDTWQYITWDLRDRPETPDDSISIQEDTNTFFWGTYCIGCGFSFEMEFKKSGSDWYMVYRQENNF